MAIIECHDNSVKSLECDTATQENLRAISNRSLRDIIKDNPDLMVFPSDLNNICDEASQQIFRLSENHDRFQIFTGNLMGYVGINDTEISITSRFAKEESKDYFLSYLLSRVLHINLFDLKHSEDRSPVFDFLILLFPIFLNKAMSNGIFKKYQTNSYNNPNVSGTIDIAAHIRQNVPFRGNVAYQRREWSFDNTLTQLIRHTIELIAKTAFGKAILTSDQTTKSNVAVIRQLTPSYNRLALSKVVNSNLKPISHPYFVDYLPLQKLCLMILRHDKIKYGADKDKIYGILFDGAWLWEEYLGIVLKDSFNHYYRDRKPRFYLFENHVQQIIPDYISKDRAIVADAKYIPLDRHTDYGEERANAIYYKTIMYMFRFKTDHGMLFFPTADIEAQPKNLYVAESEKTKRLTKIPLVIPYDAASFKDFVKDINDSEQDFIYNVINHDNDI